MRPMYPVPKFADKHQHHTGRKRWKHQQDVDDPGHLLLKELESEIVQLHETVKLKEDQICTLEKENNSFRSQIEELKEGLKAKGQTNKELYKNANHLKDKIRKIQTTIDGLKMKTDKRKSEIDLEDRGSASDKTTDVEHMQRHRDRRNHQTSQLKGKLNAEKNMKKEDKQKLDELVAEHKLLKLEHNKCLGRRNVKTRGMQTSHGAYERSHKLKLENQKLLKWKEEYEQHMRRSANIYNALLETNKSLERRCLQLDVEISSNCRRFEFEKHELQSKCKCQVQQMRQCSHTETAKLRKVTDELKNKLDTKSDELRQLNEDLQNTEKNLENEKSKSAMEKAQFVDEQMAIEEQSKKCKNELEDIRRKNQCILEPLRALFTDPEGVQDKCFHLIQLLSMLVSRDKNEEHSVATNEFENGVEVVKQ